MARSMKEAHKKAFEALEDDCLYAAPDVARLAKFEGSGSEIKKKRDLFRKNLNGFYRDKISVEPDHKQVEGLGSMLYPAYLGRHWKQAAGITTA